MLTAGAVAPALSQESGTTPGLSTQRDMTYRGQGYDVLDSGYVPRSRMKQQRQFLNHQYNFPAKPRAMWEVGVGLGIYNYAGDVNGSNIIAGGKGGYGFHGHVRKSIGHTFSLRLQYIYGRASGQNFQASGPGIYSSNVAWNGKNNGYDYRTAGAANPGSYVFENYRSESHQVYFDLIASTNNIKFYKNKFAVNVYGYVGLGLLAYQTDVNALDANGQPYNNLFTTIYNNYTKNGVQPIRVEDRRQIVSDLQSGMDDTYETEAESQNGTSKRNFGNKTVDAVGAMGLGAQFRISRHVNIGVEDRFTFITGDDYLDGRHWAPGNAAGPVPSTSNDAVNYFSVGINFNLGGKQRVEPLYWVNPLDYIYSELNSPRHMLLPEPTLNDADGDGVVDQMDKCPNTPNGVAVDSHGCPMDSDGDGVPDDRDKELITPTECQPVDADGVGKCPCHCEQTAVPSAACNVSSGTISFTGTNTRIAANMQPQLATLAAQMQASPTCKTVLIGQGNESKLQQQRSWDRVNAIQEYMSEKHNIDRNRFIFKYGEPGDPNSVMYRSAQSGEDGPSTTPPPHPQLSNQK